MDETELSNSVKKRLAMQNEVYKWISEFSERMEKRSKEATYEVNGLLDQAGILEADLKNTFNLFRSLSHTRYIDHRIADDNDMDYHKKKNVNRSVECIPAQNYEADILPRYKEALSLGLTSCKDYLSAQSSTSVRSFFSTAAVHGQLPYIIGSEEYNHDSSCGLTEDIALSQQPLDFTRLAEPSGVSSVAADHAPSDLFGLRMLSMRQDTQWKDGSEPLVSAASDFKSMLEAALLSTYKFYDDESFSIHDPRSTGGTKTDMNQEASTSSQAVTTTSFQGLRISEEKTVPAAEANQTTLQDTDFHAPELYSALVSGSLFDADEDPTLAPDTTLDNPARAATSPITVDGVNEKSFEQKGSLEDVSTLKK